MREDDDDDDDENERRDNDEIDEFIINDSNLSNVIENENTVSIEESNNSINSNNENENFLTQPRTSKNMVPKQTNSSLLANSDDFTGENDVEMNDLTMEKHAEKHGGEEPNNNIPLFDSKFNNENMQANHQNFFARDEKNNEKLIRSETVPLLSLLEDSNSNDDTSSQNLCEQSEKVFGSIFEPLVLDEPNELHKLPHKISDKGCYTNPDIVADVITNFDNYRDRFTRFYIVDCRYWYEYQGGHIKNAIQILPESSDDDDDDASIDLNECIREKITNMFFSEANLKNRSDSQRTVIFVHCEYSQKRGPEVYGFIKGIDREKHEEEWPFQLYPDVYIIHGGYKAFFASYSHLCTSGNHVAMCDSNFNEEMIKWNTRFKRVSSRNRREDRNSRRQVVRSASTSVLHNNLFFGESKKILIGKNEKVEKGKTADVKMGEAENEREKGNGCCFSRVYGTPYVQNRMDCSSTPFVRKTRSNVSNNIFESNNNDDDENSKETKENNDDANKDDDDDIIIENNNIDDDDDDCCFLRSLKF